MLQVLYRKLLLRLWRITSSADIGDIALVCFLRSLQGKKHSILIQLDATIFFADSARLRG